MENLINSKRRDFLKQSGTILGFGLMLPVLPAILSSCSSSPTGPTLTEITISLADYPGLSVDGTAVKVSKSGFNPVIVTRLSPGVFRTLSARCTHEGGTVDLPVNNRLRCPNHGAIFSALDGSVLTGPASSPLQTYTHVYDGTANTLTIKS